MTLSVELDQFATLQVGLSFYNVKGLRNEFPPLERKLPWQQCTDYLEGYWSHLQENRVVIMSNRHCLWIQFFKYPVGSRIYVSSAHLTNPASADASYQASYQASCHLAPGMTLTESHPDKPLASSVEKPYLLQRRLPTVLEQLVFHSYKY